MQKKKTWTKVRSNWRIIMRTSNGQKTTGETKKFTLNPFKLMSVYSCSPAYLPKWSICNSIWNKLTMVRFKISLSLIILKCVYSLLYLFIIIIIISILSNITVTCLITIIFNNHYIGLLTFYSLFMNYLKFAKSGRLNICGR